MGICGLCINREKQDIEDNNNHNSYNNVNDTDPSELKRRLKDQQNKIYTFIKDEFVRL